MASTVKEQNYNHISIKKKSNNNSFEDMRHHNHRRGNKSMVSTKNGKCVRKMIKYVTDSHYKFHSDSCKRKLVSRHKSQDKKYKHLLCLSSFFLFFFFLFFVDLFKLFLIPR